MSGQIQILEPIIADSAIDNRGVVYTYLPQDNIKEFNYIFTRAGSNRGFHCHTEFDEYVMLVDGEMIIIENLPNGTDKKIVLGPGHTVRIPQSVVHVFVPVTDCKFINFLTRPWHLCNQPITKSTYE
jgi:mannose-6-phosphate isomerase-like protein (cupin superfamily)